MNLYQKLQTAQSEEDVKDAYISALKLKKVTKGLIDIQTEEIWSHGKPNSLAVKVPPLATVYLYKAAEASGTEDADKVEGEA